MDKRIESIVFDEEAHRYFLGDRELKGITHAIGKYMGKSFPDTDTVMVAKMLGDTVHKEVENYYNDSKEVSTESAKWVVNELKDFMDLLPVAVTGVKCEVMVSDFETTASKVDVVVHCLDGTCYLFDVKTTSKFDREYCSLQLSVYKRLYEACYEEKVMGLYVLGTKMRRLFHIIEQDKAKTDKILSMNR